MEYCTLCTEGKATPYWSDQQRPYYRCQYCDFIFVPPSHHLSPALEKARYDEHTHQPMDAGYQLFLNKLVEPMSRYLIVGMRGLDFGAGSAGVSHLLKTRGFDMERYDPLYPDISSMPDVQFDFVACTEVVEHFNQPRQAWSELINKVGAAGILGVMTLRHDVMTSFDNWWYKNDKTHIAFYSSRTFQYISRQFNLEILMLADRVSIFRKRCLD